MSNPIYLIGLIFLCLIPRPSSNINTVDEYCINDKAVEIDISQNCRLQEGFSFSTDPVFLSSFNELTVPVVFWGINKDDGSSEEKFTQDKVDESMKLLNSAFKEMKINFVLEEFKTINSSEIYWTDYYAFNKYIKANSYTCETALNIYVPFRFTNFQNNLRGGKWSWNQLSVNMLNYNTGILPHEVGHIFGLNHMHSGAKASNCERVTRDKNDPEYNAHCAGDLVTDTNAMPIMYNRFHLINENCEYTGQLKNCKGEPYQLTEDDIRNFMGYTQHDCRSKFTVGQGVRAREYIEKYSKLNRYQFIIGN